MAALNRALAALLVLAGCRPEARTASHHYHVSNLGGDDGHGCAAARSAARPLRSLAAGLACLQPGDTLVLAPGRYDEPVRRWPNGAPGRPITIRAADDASGSVILEKGLNLDPSNAHLVFSGLRFHREHKAVVGRHLIFRANEWRGGCPQGECGGVVVGGIDAGDTADILFEDNWFHGAGGRVNLALYNAARVVIRRAVIRHDGGWRPAHERADGREPEAGLAIENSRDALIEDVLVVDARGDSPRPLTAFAVGKDASTSTQTRRVHVRRSWAVGGAGNGFRTFGTGPIEELTIEDVWLASRGDGMVLGTGPLPALRIVGVEIRKLGRSGDGEPSVGVTHGGAGEVWLEEVHVAGHSRPLVGVRLDGGPARDRPPPLPPRPWPYESRIQRELCIDRGRDDGLCAAGCVSAYLERALGWPGVGRCAGLATGNATAAARGTAAPAPVAPAEPGVEREPAALLASDSVPLSCPAPACLEADPRGGFAIDEFPAQDGRFRLHARLTGGTDARGWLALAEEIPARVAEAALAVRIGPQGLAATDGPALAPVRPIPHGAQELRLVLAVDVRQGRYDADVVDAAGHSHVLGRGLALRATPSRLAFTALVPEAGTLRVCRESLAGPPGVTPFVPQAGAFVARVSLGANGGAGAPARWLGFAGAAAGRRVPEPIFVLPLDGWRAGATLQLRVDVPGGQYVAAGSAPGRTASGAIAPDAVEVVDRCMIGTRTGEPEACAVEVRALRCVAGRRIAAQWVHQSFCPQRTRFTASAELRPAPGRLDGALALASGRVAEWNSLGPIVRMNLDGRIDAVDGPTYRPSVVAYQPGQRHRVRLEVDPRARRYDAFVTVGDGAEQELGVGLRFRNQALDRFDAFVLPLDRGGLEACDLTVAR